MSNYIIYQSFALCSQCRERGMLVKLVLSQQIDVSRSSCFSYLIVMYIFLHISPETYLNFRYMMASGTSSLESNGSNGNFFPKHGHILT